MQRNDFHNELDSFEIHLPARNIVKFSNDEALQDFMDHQYPRWNLTGNVTSIPVFRTTKLFLTGEQLSETVRERFKSCQKGECGEIKVYESLLQTSENLDDGILVLPNMDGNHFSSKEAHVELDVVVVHPKKGIFVLNVKNAINIKEKNLAEDMRKHTNFIRLLRDYNATDDNKTIMAKIPVHGIICSLLENIEESKLKKNKYLTSAKENESRLIFQPVHMLEFSNTWKAMLQKIPSIENTVTLDSFKVLIARLTALNSMEGSVALLHERFTSNEIQKIYRKPAESRGISTKQLQNNVNENFPQNDTVDDEINVQLSEQFNKVNLKEMKKKKSKKKTSVILWTKEQLNIISHVGKVLLQPKSVPCRLVIKGPKGSGKTMLLTYIAHLAKNIFHSRNNDSDGNVVICDGRMGSSQIIFEKLKADFKDTGIDVEGMSFQTNPKERKTFDGRSLILFDECTQNLQHYIKNMKLKFHKDQHVIFFHSKSDISLNDISPSYETLEMTNTLRATRGLIRFIDKFRIFNPLCKELPTIACHNLAGVGPDIRCITVDTTEDPQHLKYVNEALSAITEGVEKAKGLKNILVTPFVHPITLERIIREVQTKGFDYEYKNPSDFLSKSPRWKISELDDEVWNSSIQNLYPSTSGESSLLPQITFVTGNHVDGAEYGGVIVLLERSLPQWWDEFIFDSMYIAITRATCHLSIVINNTDKVPMILQKTIPDNKEAATLASSIWSKVYNPLDVNIPAYTFYLSTPEHYSQHLLNIISQSSWSKYPVLVIGKLPFLPQFTKIDTPGTSCETARPINNSRCDENWFRGPNNEIVVSSSQIRSIWKHLELNTLNELKMGGFSAIVFFIETTSEYSDFCCKIERHRLLYNLHEHQLGSCPIYMASPFSPVSKSPDSKCVCDFIFSQNSVIADNLVSPKCDCENNNPPQVISWEDFKQKGTSYLKEGKVEVALSHYMKSTELLKVQYDESLLISDVEHLIRLSEDLSKLYTNVSKLNFDIGKSMQNEVNIRTSLQYAEKSLEINPSWDKGYHRMAEALLILGDKDRAATTKDKGDYIRKRENKYHYEIKRDIVLRMKMTTCCSWELVKFKQNAFLVDRNGQGHFQDISEALEKKGYNSISLIINPGVHESKFPLQLIQGATVDLVGNWEPILCPEYKWLLKESPVVIQDLVTSWPYSRNTIGVHNSTLFVSRISIYNWQPRLSHSIYSTETSTVTLMQCAFKSQCGAAIVCTNNSNLNIIECLSTNTFGGVLVLEGSSASISRSKFHKSKIAGLVFRENVSAIVDHCSVLHCEAQGILCIRSKIQIKSCLLEYNGYKMSVDEGSVQLYNSTAVISRTRIQNQIGNGIVIENGSGRFEDLKIDRCEKSGILICAPTTVRQCKITHCRIGIALSSVISEGVSLENNIIEQCNVGVFSYSRSSKSDDIAAGEILHKKTQDIRKVLEGGPRHYESLNHYLESQTSRLSCSYCTSIIYDNPDKNYFLCEHCESELYCSPECCSKNNEFHQELCKIVQMRLNAYKGSIYFSRTQEQHQTISLPRILEKRKVVVQRKRGNQQERKRKSMNGRIKNWFMM